MCKEQPWAGPFEKTYATHNADCTNPKKSAGPTTNLQRRFCIHSTLLETRETLMVFSLTSLVSASLGLKATQTLIFGLWCLLQLQQSDFCASLHMFTHKSRGLLFSTNL